MTRDSKDDVSNGSPGIDAGEEDSAVARRKTLRRILTGTGVLAGAATVPSKWSKPVIDSITLPAHATVISGGTGDMEEG